MKFSSKIEKCGLSPMRKFAPYANEAVKNGKKLYHLNIGQPDIATPAAYFEAVKNFSQPVLAYAPSDGVPVMIDAVVDYYGKIGAPITNKQVLISTGGSEALQMALSSILDEGDEIIIPEPFYPNYSTFVTLTGATIRPVTTKPEEGYKFAIRERIEACINEHTRAILFTNPGNPTGTILTEEELRLMADIAKEHDLFLICDEVYREFCYDEKFGVPTMAHFHDIDDNLVIIDSVSKRFSACGARVGCVVTKNPELQSALLKFCQSRLSVATIDQIGAAALYSVDPSFFRQCKEEYRIRRDTVISRLRQIPGVVVEEPMGAFYVMASLPVDDADRFQHWLLDCFDDKGDTVMFAPGAPFYETPGKGINEVRIAYVLKQEDLARAMEVLAKGIARYQREVMNVVAPTLG